MATKRWVEAPDALPESMTVPIFPSSPFAGPTDLSSPRSYLGGVEGEERDKVVGGEEGEEGEVSEESEAAEGGAGNHSAKPTFTAEGERGKAEEEEEEGRPAGMLVSGEGTKFPPLKVR